jgi:hypothetical protein
MKEQQCLSTDSVLSATLLGNQESDDLMVMILVREVTRTFKIIDSYATVVDEIVTYKTLYDDQIHNYVVLNAQFRKDFGPWKKDEYVAVLHLIS